LSYNLMLNSWKKFRSLYWFSQLKYLALPTSKWSKQLKSPLVSVSSVSQLPVCPWGCNWKWFPLFLCLSIVHKHRIQLFNSLRKFQDVLNLDILFRKTFQCYMTRYKEKENLLNHVNLLLPIMKWWTLTNRIRECNWK
jgi:hypothetical protein